MIFYLDTSALVKKYVQEAGSERVIEFWKEAEGLAISKVGYAECLAAFHRKKREGEISGRQFGRIRRIFLNDWTSFMRVDLSTDVEKIIGRLVMKHPLRGFDAIHLASCLSLKKALKSHLSFVAADVRLLEAASKERLMIRNVSSDTL